MLGLTIKKPEPPTNNNDLFSSPRPQYSISEDAIRLEHTTPPIKETTPASPVIQGILKAVQGNDKLAQLILEASQKAKEAARYKEELKEERGPKKASKTIIEAPEKNQAPQVLFTDADRCKDDEEFIKRTRNNIDFYSIEMRRLFFANGGQAYLDRGLLYGQAFDMIRRDKMAALKKLVIDPNEPYWRRCEIPSTDQKVYVAGLPTDDLRLRRAFAKDMAFERKASEVWMNN